MLRALLVSALAACGTLSACAAMLPRTQTDTEDTWKTFDEARATIEAIVPGETTRGQLAERRIDPYANPAVTILSFSDIAQRFAIGSALKAEQLDKGIYRCLVAGKACTGYSIAVQHRSSTRSGDFWPDFLNFRRETDITGWTFNALILMVEDIVVYTLYGGQPKLHEHEVARNPLGPLQGRGGDIVPPVRP